MADDAQQLKDDLEELRKLGQKLGQSVNFENLKNDAKAVEALLKAWRKEFAEINSEFSDLSSTFKNVLDDLKNFNDNSGRITKSFRVLGSLADKLKYDALDINKLGKKDLENIQKKAKIELENLRASKIALDEQGYRYLEESTLREMADQKHDKQIAKEAAALLELRGIFDENNNLRSEDVNYVQRLINLTKERLKEEERIQETLGISGKIVDGIVHNLGKLGISSTFFKNLKEDMETVAKTGTKLDVMMKGMAGVVSGVSDALKDPVTQLTILLKIANFFFKAALKANAQAVELGKSLGYGADRADDFREKMVAIERSSNSLNVTTANLTQAFGELAKATGFAYEYSADQLVTQIKLTKQIGLQVDEAAQVQRYSALTGKTSEETYRSFLKGIVATRNQLKVGIDFKATLAEAVKVSGQLAANLGFNPERIAKAVVTAKALGLTFEQLKSSTSSLLSFATSLESELDAELLIGKQLNLERARAAALAGDQVTLAEELAKNVGTAADFTRLNVLQQDALSKAVGMTSDQLAETLRKREEAVKSGKSLAQVTEEEAAKALERQSVQDKFNAAIEKLQSLIGNILAGPLAGFLDVLSGALNMVNLLGNALSFLATPLQVIAGLWLTIKGIQLASLASTKAMTIYEGMKRAYVGTQVSMATGYNAALLIRKSLLAGELAKTIAIAAAWAVANPLTALVGLGVAAAVSAGLYSMLKGDDIMSEGGYGKRTLLSPEGAIKLNDKDTIIAGTDLGGGQNNISGPSIDLTPMIAAINEVRSAVNNLANRPIYLSIDGKNIGTALVQGSHKVA